MPSLRIFCTLVILCALLPATGLAADAQQDVRILRNKRPPQPTEQADPALPAQPGTVQPTLPAPHAPQGTAVIVLPQGTAPGVPPKDTEAPGTTPPVQLIVPPTTQQPAVPGTVDIQPVQPAQPPLTPTMLPTQPVQPVLPVVPVQPEQPKQADPTETPKAEKPVSPADFLFKTALEPQSPPEPKQEAPKLAEKPKPKTPPAEKPTEKPTEPPKKPDEKPAPPKPGDPLKIPETAKVDQNLDFLEGCWVGTRPEYSTKRIVTEKFCFDSNGVGKRRIIDPQEAGTCVGATRASVGPNGVLTMRSELMSCTSGNNWAASTMTCQGEGEKTPCTWVFKTSLGAARQSYSINFVRE